MSAKLPDRHGFLKASLAAGAGVLFMGEAVAKAAEACGVTPAQTPGPFYPGESQFAPENDLTRVNGRPQAAEGQVVYVEGQVLDAECKPVAGAAVEIWQACASGKYNNPNDPNTAVLDPDFKYWGETYTDAQGRYDFKTIRPGAYPADVNWMRPPHIHFKISKLGYKELITQMYFKGDPLNEKDLILLDVPESERDSVQVDFQPAPVDGRHEPGALIGRFDIFIRPVGRARLKG